MNQFNKTINRLGTYCTQWDFVKDRFGKDDVLPFTISDMDISTSPEILLALQKRVDHGIFGYTRWNHPDFKNAIISWYQKRFDCPIQDSWIAYTPSVIYGIVKVLSVYNPQKKPICFITPCYDGFMKILSSNDYPTKTVHQSLDNGVYNLDWNELETALSQSKVFLLCNPNNPNGYVWSAEDLTKIIELCKKHKVIIVSDDIHMDFVYKPALFTPIIKVAQKMDYLDNVVIITSSAKTFNLSSLGGAYIICPNITKLAEYVYLLGNKDSLSSAPALFITSLITGYTQSEAWTDELIEYCHQNLIFVKEYLEKHLPTLSVTIPEGTYFAWIDCSKLGIPMSEIQDKLLNIGKVAIMDGDRYEESAPFLRMIIACPRSKVEDGLKRLVKSLL